MGLVRAGVAMLVWVLGAPERLALGSWSPRTEQHLRGHPYCLQGRRQAQSGEGGESHTRV